MKRRSINPNWTINEDKSVFNSLDEFMGYAVLNEHGEYKLSKTEPKTLDDLLIAIAK